MKRLMSLFLALAMIFSTIISPSFTINVAAQTTTVEATKVYSTNEVTKVSSGSNAINASSDVESFKNLEEATINLSASCTGSSVNALFFMGDSSAAANYYVLYLNGTTLGVEYKGSTTTFHKTVALSDIDFTQIHKFTLIHDKNDNGTYALKIFVDGVLKLNESVNAPFSKGEFEAADYVGFGNGARNGNTYPFTGSLTNIEFYNVALDASAVMDYVTKDRSDLVFELGGYSSNGINVSSADIEEIVGLSSGTIQVRYRVNDATSRNKMTLFVLQDTYATSYFRLWVVPGLNKFGVDINGDEYKSFEITNHSGINDTKWHTITIRVDNDENLIADKAGIHFTLDDEYIAGNKYTGSEYGRTGMFTNVKNADSMYLGYLYEEYRSEDIDGNVDFVKIYSGILSNEEIAQKANEFKYNGGMIVDPNGTYKTQDQALFYPGYDNSNAYRIPSLLTTKEGTIIAAIDERHSGTGDSGNIDTIIRRKEKDSENFDASIVVVDPLENPDARHPMMIDPSMVQDRDSGRIFMLVDMFPESSGLMDSGIIEAGAGATVIDGKSYYLVYQNGKEYGTIREGGKVFDMNGVDTGYTVVTQCEAPYRELGDVYFEGEYQGNVHIFTGRLAAPFQMLRTQRLWLTYSDDDGKTWSCPQDITAQVKPDWCMFAGVGPGVGLQLIDGSLAFPVYTCNKASGLSSQCSALIISKDGGETWELSGSPSEALGYNPATMSGGTQLTECQVVQLNNGDLKFFMRGNTGKVNVSTSKDGGYTWQNTTTINIPEVYCQLSVDHYTKNDKEYIVLSNPSGPGRANGKVYIFEVLPDGSFDLENMKSQQINLQRYCYSCIQVLDEKTTITNETNKGVRDVVTSDNVKFGLIYEDDTVTSMTLYYTEFDEAWVNADLVAKPQSAPVIVDSQVEVAPANTVQNTMTLTLTLDQVVFAGGRTRFSLVDDQGNAKGTLFYKDGSGTNVVTFEGLYMYNDISVLYATNLYLEEGYFEGSDIQDVAFDGKILVVDNSQIEASISEYSTQHSTSTQENTDGAASNAVDGNPNTYWHSTWGNNAITLPQYIVLDLGEVKPFQKLTYTPRQNSQSGRVTNYEVYVSNDKEEYTFVKEGTLSGGAQSDEIYLGEQEARYIKFNVTKSTVDGSCNVAELVVSNSPSNAVVGDKTELLSVEAKVRNIIKEHEDLFTTASIKYLMRIYERVKAVDESADQATIDGIYKALCDAIDSLTLVKGVEEAIEKAESLDEADYESGWSELQSVLADVKANYQNDMTQQASTARIMKIEYAIKTLVKKGADKTQLQALYDEVKDYEEASYTASSFAPFKEALANAKALLDNVDATQEEVDSAKADLEAKANDLVKVDKTALKEAIEVAKKVDTTNKTEDSVAALANALTVAETLYANADATQASIDEVKANLEAAVANLKDKPEEPKPVMDFYDVQDKKAWFYGSVESAFTKGLMGATGKEPVNGKPFFEPDTAISRGMVATVLYRMAGKPAVEFKATFSDVTNPKLWYSTAITWASQAGVVSGYKDGSFGPDDNITRQDLAIMLRNYAKSCGLDTDAKVDFSAFKDGNKVVSYAQSAIAFCIDAKLMSGAKKADGVYLNPSDNATRAECAKMFSLLDDAIKAHNAK